MTTDIRTLQLRGIYNWLPSFKCLSSLPKREAATLSFHLVALTFGNWSGANFEHNVVLADVVVQQPLATHLG